MTGMSELKKKGIVRRQFWNNKRREFKKAESDFSAGVKDKKYMAITTMEELGALFREYNVRIVPKVFFPPKPKKNDEVK